MRTFLQRLSVFPFEALLGGLAIYSGVVGFFNLGTSTDALNILLNPLLVDVLNVTYVASGAGMIAGVGLGRADVEGFGLIGLAGAVVARFIAVIGVAGIALAILPLTILYAMTLVACWVRFRSLARRETVVRLSSPPTVPMENVQEDFGGQ